MATQRFRAGRAARIARSHAAGWPMTGSERPGTRDPGYAKWRASSELVWWKRMLDVQYPYRAHLRRLQLGFVLDVGCGIGRNLVNLGPSTAVGTDHNARAVEIARARGLVAFTPEQLRASIYAMPGRFDSLLVSHVLEHMATSDAVALIRAHLGYVRPGGHIVVITPQEMGFRSDPTHVTFMDFHAVGQVLRQPGLAPVSQYSFRFPRRFGRLFKYNEFVSIAVNERPSHQAL